MKGVTLFSQQGITVKFTGEQLNQEDMSVWMSLVDLARLHPLGNECGFTAYSILKHMGLGVGGEQRKVLHNAISRLTECTVRIENERTEYAGHLIDEYRIDKETNHYKITLNKNLICLFGEDNWTAVNWTQRMQLRSKPLAQKLHDYYSSHKTPKPVTIDFLYNITGSTNKDKYSFKRQVKTALSELVKITFLESCGIEGNLVTAKRAHKASRPENLTN